MNEICDHRSDAIYQLNQEPNPRACADTPEQCSMINC